MAPSLVFVEEFKVGKACSETQPLQQHRVQDLFSKGNLLLLASVPLQHLATKTNRVKAVEEIIQISPAITRFNFSFTLVSPLHEVSIHVRVLNPQNQLQELQRLEIGMTETCRNPWNGKCTNSDIELYIYYKNKALPICSRCWSQIAEKDIEW